MWHLVGFGLVGLLAGCTGASDDTTDPTDGVSPTADTSDTGPTYVDADSDGYTSDVDCDDTDASINPEATEVCDGVDNDCNDSIDEVGGASVAGMNYSTLDEGIAAAIGSAEPTVNLCPRGDAHLITPVVLSEGEALTVRGVGGREYSEVRVNTLGTAFTVHGGATLILEGLTLNQPQRRPLEIIGDGHATIRACAIDPRTGGVLVGNEISKVPATLAVEDSDFRGVEVEVGSAIAASGRFGLTVRRCSFLGNSGVNSDGAGIHAVGAIPGESSLLIEQVRFENNSGDSGGAIFASGVDIRASDSSFINNEAAKAGGAVLLERGATFDGGGTTEFLGNDALDGGAIFVSDGEVRGVRIADENAAETGGGISVRLTDVKTPLLLSDVEIVGNVAYDGGGIYVGSRSEVILDKTCTLHGNTALKSQGGGAFLAGLGSVLESQGATWSDGASVNTPADVEFNTGSSLTFGTPTPQVRCSFGTGSCDPL